MRKLPISIGLLLAGMLACRPLAALETKTYQTLNTKVAFQGAKKICASTLTYKGAALTSSKNFISSYSTTFNQRVKRKVFQQRQTGFNINALDFIRLIRAGDTPVKNRKLVATILTNIVKSKDPSAALKSTNNLRIVTTTVGGLKGNRPNLTPGVYLLNRKKKMLFALASLKDSAFALSESCAPKRGRSRSLRERS